MNDILIGKQQGLDRCLGEFGRPELRVLSCRKTSGVLSIPNRGV